MIRNWHRMPIQPSTFTTECYAPKQSYHPNPPSLEQLHQKVYPIARLLALIASNHSSQTGKGTQPRAPTTTNPLQPASVHPSRFSRHKHCRQQSSRYSPPWPRRVCFPADRTHDASQKASEARHPETRPPHERMNLSNPGSCKYPHTQDWKC